MSHYILRVCSRSRSGARKERNGENYCVPCETCKEWSGGGLNLGPKVRSEIHVGSKTMRIS